MVRDSMHFAISAKNAMKTAYAGFRLLLAVCGSLSLLVSSGLGAETSTEEVEFFESKIRPIFITYCYECHSLDGKKSQGGLLLDTREGLLKGGDSGPAVVPGKPEQSLLIRAVRRTDENLKMPPKQKLSDRQIADLVEWVRKGTPDPRKTGKPLRGLSLEEGLQFWSFQPVREQPVPPVADSSWPLTPVDNFILSRLEQSGLAPAPQADKQTLLRRVTFDLTGLPPTPEERSAFLTDNSPQAFERVVDRLLASTRYGERWGRHWLDVVRYADTCGNASDYPVPQAHKYRDWVIRAFNQDLPYDQFLREQIAGDLLPSDSADERYEQITATGYLAIARRFGGDRMGEHHLTLEDTIDNLGRAILGCSISCARCHDHKFDPFTTSDYYGLYGIFNSTRYPFPGAEVGRKQEDFIPLMSSAEIETLLQPHREQVAAGEAVVKQRAAEETEAKKLPDGAEKTSRVEAAGKALAEARAQLAAIQARAPQIDSAYAVVEGAASNAKIHVRGDPKRLGSEVPRHFPTVLGGQNLPRDCATSGRLELAQWLTDPKNPLTARVMVNRIWQQHFGKGIVQTPNDFGRQGKPPTHPELLDDLARRFIESGWSIKAIHKLILLSRAWQLASADVSGSAGLDSQNDLFGRFTRRRLDAESIRDALLFVSGELDERLGGPHPFPPSNAWNWTQHNPFVAQYESRRRSVYLMQQRLRKHPYLALFDGADPSSSTGIRLPSTTPLQALFLMNDPLVHEAADKFAGRVIAEEPDESRRIDLAYLITLNREPVAEEQRECAEFLSLYRKKLAALKTPADRIERLAWSALARALLSGNEFVFVD